MSDIRLKKPSTSGSGGKASKVVSTQTGALIAGVPKAVSFTGGATFPAEDYILQVQDVNMVVLVDTLVKGDAIGTVDSARTTFTITVLVDLPAGLTVVAVGA